MQFTDARYPNGALPVDGYGTRFFRVGGALYEGPVIVASDIGVVPWGGLDERAALLALEGKIDVLFLGMGADIAIPSRELIEALDAKGIMAEPMTSASAARSYNVLLAEGRRVGCALIPI